MAGAGRMGYASVSARENGSSLCDDAFCAYCGNRSDEIQPIFNPGWVSAAPAPTRPRSLGSRLTPAA